MEAAGRKGRLVAVLSSWRFWMVLWGFALVGAIIFSLITYSSAQGDHAARLALERSQYQQCVQFMPTLRRVNRFFHGVEDLHRILVTNAKAMHEATPPGSPVYEAQIVNLHRLERTVHEVSGVQLHVPSIAECRAASHLR